MFLSLSLWVHLYHHLSAPLSIFGVSLSLFLYFSMVLSVIPIIYLCVRVYLPLSTLCIYLSLTPSFCNSQHRHRQGNSNDEDEEGYATDSGSVMTDYTSDTYNDNYSSAYDDYDGGENSEWQEFWDEQAQGKYWYNNISGNLTVSFHWCSFNCCDFSVSLFVFLSVCLFSKWNYCHYLQLLWIIITYVTVQLNINHRRISALI